MDVYSARRTMRIGTARGRDIFCGLLALAGFHSWMSRPELSFAASRSAKDQTPQLPRHPRNERVNLVLERAESLLRDVYQGNFDPPLRPPASRGRLRTAGTVVGLEDKVYANTYVSLGHAEVVGFDYDYTLVSYRPAVLHLIYTLAKTYLVDKAGYPAALQHELTGYDPAFAIRGLAVDLETSWICKTTFRYRVAAAFFGRERVEPALVRDTYRSQTGGVLPHDERKRRLRPLNDLFSMVEACLLADLVQWFKDRSIPFCSRSVVTDVLNAVGKAHTSGEMHKEVAANLDEFIEPDATRHLRQLLEQLKLAGKKLMLVSNSEFWYVNKGMSHVVGQDWRDLFDVVVVSAEKPAFYTQQRPFREVSARTGRVKFKPIHSLEPNEVYSSGSISELMKLTRWGRTDSGFDGSKIMYFGDSIFADLVEARRLFGWTTGAIIREVRNETHVQSSSEWRQAKHIVQALLHCLQLCQEEMGAASVEEGSPRQGPRTDEDQNLLDSLEALVATWRQHQDCLINSNFGSIFHTNREVFTCAPSLYTLFLQQHADLYTSRIENLRLYSTDHRFYPLPTPVWILHESAHASDSIVDRLMADIEAAEPPAGAG